MNTQDTIFVQTFIAPKGLDILKIKYHIYMMFLSFLSIRKVYPNTPFFLITNSESYDYVKEFPYTEILTSLDDYPVSLKPSFSKVHSIDILKGERMVHFDNDVFLWDKLPDFKDTIVQSAESNFIEFFYHCKLKHHKWVFPDFVKTLKSNYNPGTFGFSADSAIRDEYYELAVEYHDKNQRLLESMPPSAEKQMMVANLQDIFAMIEEGFLYHLVDKRDVDVALVLPDKYDTDSQWGSKEDGFRSLNTESLDYAHYHSDYCHERYVHLMGWATSRLDYTQNVLDRVYHNNREIIHEHFSIKV